MHTNTQLSQQSRFTRPTGNTLTTETMFAWSRTSSRSHTGSRCRTAAASHWVDCRPYSSGQQTAKSLHLIFHVDNWHQFLLMCYSYNKMSTCFFSLAFTTTSLVDVSAHTAYVSQHTLPALTVSWPSRLSAHLMQHVQSRSTVGWSSCQPTGSMAEMIQGTTWQNLCDKWDKIFTGPMQCLSPNNQCHGTEGNTNHWPQPVAWSHPFFICHWTAEGNCVTPFMPPLSY